MIEFFNFKQKIDLEDYILFIPSVSVGNVPQLTIDLLISSLNFIKVATIWHPGIISSVGSDPYVVNGPEICTACELYINEEIKIALIQLRSTIESRLAVKFFMDLKTSLQHFKIKSILILTSSFDYELHDVSNNKFFYVTNEQIEDVMKNFNVKSKEKEFTGRYIVHGSGFAVKLFEVLESNFNCTILIKYVSEGDNRPDAIATLDIISKFVGSLNSFSVNNVKFPSSWNCLFGGPPPLGIF